MRGGGQKQTQTERDRDRDGENEGGGRKRRQVHSGRQMHTGAESGPGLSLASSLLIHDQRITAARPLGRGVERGRTASDAFTSAAFCGVEVHSDRNSYGRNLTIGPIRALLSSGNARCTILASKRSSTSPSSPAPGPMVLHAHMSGVHPL